MPTLDKRITPLYLAREEAWREYIKTCKELEDVYKLILKEKKEKGE